MTRREILEKNWKDFRSSTGLEYEPMSDKAYEFMENAMEQYAELCLGDVRNKSEQLFCESCGEKFTPIDKWNFHCQNCQPCEQLEAN